MPISSLLFALKPHLPEPDIRKGVELYRTDCVLAVETSGASTIGFVEDGSARDVHQTRIRWRDGRLVGSCSCDDDLPCCHMVATALSVSEQRGEGAAEPDGGDRLMQRALRRIRDVDAKTVFAEPLSVDGGGYGTWYARPMGRHRPWDQIQMVEFLSARRTANSCTCRAFRYDQLGTCRHIEAIRPHVDPNRAELSPLVWLDRGGGSPQLVYSPVGGADVLFDVAGDGLAEAVRDLGGTEVPVSRAVTWYLEDLERSNRDKRPDVDASLLDVTERFCGELQRFQQIGMSFLAERKRAILADEMGLGKTVQTIATLDWLNLHCGIDRALVVCPTSVKHQWKAEIERFAPHLTVDVTRGSAAQRRDTYDKRPNVVIANYEAVMRDYLNVNDCFAPQVLVLDEAQRIKNRDTLTAEAMKCIESEYRFLLSGTPVENCAEDLFSLMEAVDPLVLGPRWKFTERSFGDIHALSAPSILRRRVDIIRDELPRKTESTVWVATSRKQQDYQRSQLQRVSMIQDRASSEGRPISPGERCLIFSKLNAARRASISLSLVGRKSKRSAKILRLTELLVKHLKENRKIVVFSEWRDSIDLARERLKELDIPSFYFHGGIPTDRRPELIAAFRNDESAHVMFSTDAGGVGLNLQMASVVINLELPWNPAKLDQRIARVHRLGQTRDVKVYNLVGTGYEKSVMKSLERKRQTFSETIEPDLMSANRASTDHRMGYSEDDWDRG